ncbi:hypothetical protein MBCUT_06530 [Methanobrevibacter cuticularis]|uniref:Uncharacterized protein n=1 Tax=Methanobrevibacter cuticularis TaxID=47311 RepID=A0A166EG62_9EURY|nr:hypothetical protein [Methanobrevibacter cuticularis]KZX16615.1 hypothetical protein MBCUT_06530 [Methanobrevibacter cuticularis]
MSDLTVTNEGGLSKLKSKGIVTINTILTPKSIDDEIHNNELLANVFAKVIEDNHYYSEIPVKIKDKKTGKYIKEIKKWINISGWSFIDRVLKITPHIVKSELKLVKRDKAKERLEYCCTCELRTIQGIVISTGLGKASSGEEYKENFTESKLESLAQSRSISKAHRLYFQDILEKLNLNNDIIIEADFTTSFPKNEQEMINQHHSNMEKAVKDPSFDWPGDEELSKKFADKRNEYNEQKDGESSDKKQQGKITGGIVSNDEKEDKSFLDEAIDDKAKRDKEKAEFKTANNVEKNNMLDDPDARQWIREIIYDLKDLGRTINTGTIKAMAIKRMRDPESDITKEEVERLVSQLERGGIPK